MLIQLIEANYKTWQGKKERTKLVCQQNRMYTIIYVTNILTIYVVQS